MEIVSRRYSKLLMSKKDIKVSTKEKKSRGKIEDENFFAGYKKKREIARGVQKKITASKLTIHTKTLGNAVRSVYAVKEERFNYGEESKALLNEDLFKIIDLSNPTPQKQTKICAISPKNEDSSSKSLFREIEEKFQQLSPENEPYLISDDNLQELVSNKLVAQKKLILNPWAKTFQDFLYRIRADDLPEILLNRVITNQSKINETCTLFELKAKFRGVPLAGTCLRRKFTRRCNELANLQNLGGKIILTSQADDIISRIDLEPVLTTQVKENPKIRAPREVTPERGPQNFPIVSYTTPKSHKMAFNHISTTSVKLKPVFKSKTTQKYVEVNRANCTNPKFVKDHNLSKNEQKFYLSEALKVEEISSFDLSEIIERPHKLASERKRHLSPSNETSSPKSICLEPLSSIRKLSFSESFDDNHFELCLLEDVGKLNISPLKFGGLFTENGARKSDRVTPKRGLEAMLSPGELKLRRKVERNENEEGSIFSRAKRFAVAPEPLGPMPMARDTPQFKFRPRF